MMMVYYSNYTNTQIVHSISLIILITKKTQCS